MKKRIGLLLLLILIIAVTFSCSNMEHDKNLIVGKWRCELYSSDLVIEFTKDGRFIDHSSFAENKYRLENGCVVVYIENMPETEVKIEFEVSEDKLIFGELEYKRINLNLSENDKNGVSFPENNKN